MPHHHMHHMSPIQLATGISPPPPGQPAQVWPLVEPVFHFPGFEVHQSYCPTHSHTTDHIVLFHLNPGVAVTFTISGRRKIVQGKSFFNFFAGLSRALIVTFSVTFKITLLFSYHFLCGFISGFSLMVHDLVL